MRRLLVSGQLRHFLLTVAGLAVQVSNSWLLLVLEASGSPRQGKGGHPLGTDLFVVGMAPRLLQSLLELTVVCRLMRRFFLSVCR